MAQKIVFNLLPQKSSCSPSRLSKIDLFTLHAFVKLHSSQRAAHSSPMTEFALCATFFVSGIDPAQVF